MREFETRELVRPGSGAPGFVDLVRALALRAGGVAETSRPGDEGTSGEGEAEIARRIDGGGPLVFVLVDGMGLELLDDLPEGAFVRNRMVMELRAIFPSTTACALTTLATGLWPAEHGVPGWWAYLEEHGLSVTTLPFVERYSESSLSRRGVEAWDIWPREAWMKRLPDEPLAIFPKGFWDSTFSRYLRGGRRGMGYASIAQAVDAIIARVVHAREGGFTFLYLPEFDATCHNQGVGSAAAVGELMRIDAELERLARAIAGRARLVVSADHGHMNVKSSDRLALYDGDPLLALLKAPPTGEPRVPVFHVRDGRAAAFEAMFNQRYGDHFKLLRTDEADAMRLLGPDALSPLARRRWGDYFAIALSPATLRYYPPGESPAQDHRGYHAGLTPREMRIPLIVA